MTPCRTPARSLRQPERGGQSVDDADRWAGLSRAPATRRPATPVADRTPPRSRGQIPTTIPTTTARPRTGCEQLDRERGRAAGRHVRHLVARPDGTSDDEPLRSDVCDGRHLGPSRISSARATAAARSSARRRSSRVSVESPSRERSVYARDRPVDEVDDRADRPTPIRVLSARQARPSHQRGPPSRWATVEATNSAATAISEDDGRVDGHRRPMLAPGPGAGPH